jgi:hypothetical protein
MTNGVFCVDNPVECHFVKQNGSVATNQLISGKTYPVDNNVMLEMITSNKTVFYFAGGLLVETSPKSMFSINLFDQEVINLDVQPRKAEFGTHNISLYLNSGEFSIIYPVTNSSTLTISTPFTSYEMNGGKYFIRLSDKSVVVYVMEGAMNVHGDKKIDKAEKGKLSVAMPFIDPASGVNDKVLTSIKSLKPDELQRFVSPIVTAEKSIDIIQFFVVNGQVIGIRMK